MAVGEDVYCTLVMTDAYLPGAAVLALSLRDTGTTKKLACLITQDNLRHSTIAELKTLYDYVIPIDLIGNPQPANLYLMNRPDLLYTFSKITLWRLTQFRKVVYIDSDVVALRAPDELFDVQEEFAAAPDVGWPDAFNTGVMVLAPNMGDYRALRTLANVGDSFDGADQGLLNQYYEHKPWKRLSFTYNCTPSANYQYEPAYRFYKQKISMVHFIGSDKPWQQGRASQGAPNAYQELLSRWWAVYDRHFAVSTYEYAATGQREHRQERQAQRKLNGLDEEVNPTAEIPLTEPGEQAELIDQGFVEPTPTVEQRRFSAPQMEWDATRGAPPTSSKPEAANFPTTTYTFNTDPAPFRPPPRYPEPPRDMWYEVPKEQPKTERAPPPIFPWEERRSVPTRKFIEDEPAPQPEASPDLESDFAGMDELGVSAEDEQLEPKTPTIQINDGAPWQTFGAANKNAWDNVSGINDYVHALVARQKSRNKSDASSAATSALFSPTSTGSAHPDEDLVQVVEKRRESLIVTDFPSEIERPSLPVTPAPRRRPTFWGQERDNEGDLPGAEGVPDQADWDPNAQLEELRRNSLIGPGDLKMPPGARKNIPARGMVPTSIREEGELFQPTAVSAATAKSPLLMSDAPTAAAERNAVKMAPTFSEPVFGGSRSSSKSEEVLSPSATRKEDAGVAP